MPASELQLRDFAVRRGHRLVLDGVSFSLRAGEVVAVIGPNGAGKTSLLEALVGVRRRERGALTFDGRAVSTLSDCARVFSFMPDEVTPPLEASVEVIVAHALASGRGTVSQRDSLLDALALRRLLPARATELSRGERKRLALFGALCAARPVLVLDEPFGAFDPLQLRDVVSVVKSRAVEGTAVLVSIHQMTEAERAADRVVLLAEGRAVAFGSLDELRHRFDAPGATLEDLFLRALEGPTRAAP